MAYDATQIWAKNPQHFDDLRALLASDFGKAIRVRETCDVKLRMSHDEDETSIPLSERTTFVGLVETDPLTRSQARALKAQGYRTNSIRGYGSFSG